MKPLPPLFALDGCPSDYWLVVAPIHDRGRRSFDRQEVCADDYRALTVVTDEAPIVPKLPPPRRSIPRMPRA